ncbi:serine/threonine-protein kinase [Tahibacter soli]|uniref:Serine/threonine-protein kinase n=1 Tax=Tahibacter soli TaxID=2983605 RepID=A0A9X4BFP0_9GAMM|nr:serine/threonine-protein kinase [Tahibacter soli]MDC8011475.1 serine/threonine-protein kinase [Tahibacter soli]
MSGPAQTPEAWAALQRILAEVVHLSEPALSARLTELCGGDAALHAQALGLLAHRDALPERLSPARIAALLDERDIGETDDAWLGRRVGAFALDARLGRGGSGTVYRARRTDGFEQVVAVKLLHHRADAALLRRFERERSILAGLAHPHIARLFDAGTATDGTPYLVLELVDGVTWDVWLTQRTPDLRTRLQRFIAVCEAVEYAHRRLLVHRDIKPANILVDATGQPRLLDFGIAALLGGEGETTLTREGGRAMTPAYAAPEQIRGEPVTTATDVYALGLVLYETLTGRHALREPGDSDLALMRAITERDALRPSLRAAAADAPPIPPQTLRGDLDNIVLAAIEKDPQRRYGSARALIDDLEAWLAGRPVSARPHTPWYLLRKFAGRNRLAVAVAAVAAIGVLAAGAIALWQAHAAGQARALAERRFAQVRGFAGTVLFDYQEGIQKLAGSLPMQQRLVRDSLGFLEGLRAEAGDDRGLWADLAAAYLKTGDLQGNPYLSNVGDFAGAAGSYARALEALDRAAALGDAGPSRQFVRAELYARQAHLAYQDTKLEPARALYEKSLAQYAALPSDVRDDIEVTLEHADTLDFYGDLLGREGQASLLDAEGAHASYERARALRAAALARSPDEPRLAYAMYKSELREGEYQAGRNDMRRAQAALLVALHTIEGLSAKNPDDASMRREVALVYARLVGVQDALDDLDASVASALKALGIMEAMLAQAPDDDSIRQGVTATQGWAARQLIKAGRAAEAAPVIQRQIEANEVRLRAAPGNPEIEYSLSLAYRRLGEQRAAGGDYAGALAAHRRALALQQPLVAQSAEFALGAALSTFHIGSVALAAGDVAAARRELDAAVAALDALVTASPDAASYREYQADALARQGDAWSAGRKDAARADAAYRRALDAWDVFERAGVLSPHSAGKRDAVRARLVPR